MSRTRHRKRDHDEPAPFHATRCGPTRKVCFPSHESALMRAGEIVGRLGMPVPTRAYHCSFCSRWHLSSK